jgi:hypothetical protein
MADFAGQKVSFPGGLDPTNRSTNITAAVFAGARSVSLGSFPLAANAGVPQPAVTIAHRNLAGQRVETFGGQLFERIIVSPRVKDLGFVLTGAAFAVEVWNTFRDSDQTLESITISGAGGLTLTDVHGEPLVFGALDSYIYEATVPSAGPAQISQDLVFAFLSGIAGTDLVVTGSRIVMFSVAPDWGEGMEETLEYFTDVLRSYSDNEQRRALRQLPRRAMRYRALTLNARDAAGMESLIWGWQNQPFGVPWWPDAQPLLSDIPPGTLVIPVSTADRQFAAGGLVTIWADEFTFEALSIVDVNPGSVTVSSPTLLSWTGGPQTRVIPVFLCRLPSTVDVSRHSSEIDQVDLNFIGEAGQPAPATATSPTQFKGFDVLEIPPNWAKSPLKRSYKRSMVTIDPKIGPIEVIDKGGTALVGQEFPWWLDTHPVVTAFRAFILRRFGQLNSFWIPTWDQDVVLHRDVGSADISITIESVFYSRFFFPTESRRFIAFIPIDGSGNVYLKVTASADNGDGTETLTLEAPTGKNFAAASTMVSFLTLVRLEADRVSIKWDSSDHAEALLALQEVPREVP